MTTACETCHEFSWSVNASPKRYAFDAQQAAIVAALHLAFNNGAPEVHIDELRRVAGLPGQSLGSVFHKHPAMWVLIVPGNERGTWRLADPS